MFLRQREDTPMPPRRPFVSANHKLQRLFDASPTRLRVCIERTASATLANRRPGFLGSEHLTRRNAH